VELIHQFNDGEEIWCSEDTIFIKFSGGRCIAGSSALNGGFQTGMEAIFNHTLPKVNSVSELPGGSVENYLRHVADKLRLKPETSSGLITAARIKNASCGFMQYQKLVVKSVITAGIDINGVRAGDSASYYEEGGRFHNLAGTINILITINANLPVGTLLKSIITATEAKTAALQELMAPSRYSTGLATGSGTDGIIVAVDPTSQLSLVDAGSHSKLGELIGCTIKDGIKSALDMETGLSPERQLSILERLKRFNVGLEYFRVRAGRVVELEDHGEFNKRLLALFHNPGLLALAVAMIHLQDEVIWGLLPEDHAIEAVRAMMSVYCEDIPMVPPGEGELEIPIIDGLVDLVNYIVVNKLAGLPFTSSLK